MHGRGRGRRRRGRRATGMLQSALLLLLHRDRAHGYTLLERLAEFDMAAIDPSIIYRVLHDMEEQGWIESTWDEEQTQGPPRRVYSITAMGDEILAAWIAELENTRDTLDRLVGAYHLHMKEDEGQHH